MSEVAIVTDGSADLAPATADALGIQVIPVTTYVGLDVRPHDTGNAESFWEKVGDSDAEVRTAQPTPGDFYEAYGEILEERGSDTEIISIHLSKHLSNTVRSAHLAAEMLGGAQITVIDSGLVGPPLGQVVAEAASQAGEDYGLEEVKDLVYAVISQMSVLLYAKRPGSLGGAHEGFLGRLFASMTSPLRANMMTLERGDMVSVGRCRDEKQAVARLSELLEEKQVGLRRLALVGIVYAASSAPAELVHEVKTNVDSTLEVEEYAMGPVLGGLLGPGSLGVFTVG